MTTSEEDNVSMAAEKVKQGVANKLFFLGRL